MFGLLQARASYSLGNNTALAIEQEANWVTDSVRTHGKVLSCCSRELNKYISVVQSAVKN